MMYPHRNRSRVSWYLPVLFGTCIAPSVAQERTSLEAPPAWKNIRGSELKEWATWLASDERGGRLTGSAGQKAAAEYIAKHFKSLGLEPLGDERKDQPRSYFQDYPLTRTSLGKQAAVVLQGAKEGAKKNADQVMRRFSDGFSVLPDRGNQGASVEGEFVYAGFFKIARFKRGIDLKDWTGKIPVFVMHAPEGERSYKIESQFMMGMQAIGAIKRRATRCAQRGAKAAVVCLLDDKSPLANMMTYTGVAKGHDKMGNPKAMDQMGMMMQLMQGPIPTVFASQKVSKELLKRIGLTLAAANAPVPEGERMRLSSTMGSLELPIGVDKQASANNVVAVLRGTDPILSKEAVVFSAHMDHVGIRMDGDSYNGADDNASGTAGLMGIAKAFAMAGKKPRRSVIFLAVSGEELGLWGSAHYSKNPTWPAENIVANVNTDMIGRTGPESKASEITVTPSFRHRKFSTIVQDSARIAKEMKLNFLSGDKYYERSDHYNFAKIGIPVVFFCNGEHEDYHQVSDHSEKLSASKMEAIARLAFRTGELVANADTRPETLGRKRSWVPDGK